MSESACKALASYESTIESAIGRNFEAYAQIGEALWEIKWQKLYRGVAKSFDDYCRARWSFSRQWGDRLIRAFGVHRDFSGRQGRFGPTPLPRNDEQSGNDRFHLASTSRVLTPAPGAVLPILTSVAIGAAISRAGQHQSKVLAALAERAEAGEEVTEKLVKRVVAEVAPHERQPGKRVKRVAVLPAGESDILRRTRTFNVCDICRDVAQQLTALADAPEAEVLACGDRLRECADRLKGAAKAMEREA